MLRSREEMEEQDAQREHLVVRVCTYRNVTVYMICVVSEMNEEQIENIEILKCFDMIYKLKNERKQDEYLDILTRIFNGVDIGIRKVNVADAWAKYVKICEIEEDMDADDAIKVLAELLPRKRQRKIN